MHDILGAISIHGVKEIMNYLTDDYYPTGGAKSLVEKLLKIDDESYSLRLSGNLLAEYNDLYKIIDLFSGAGGMTLGFSSRFNQPFEPVWANDLNEHCVATYNYNFGPHCEERDLLELVDAGLIDIPNAHVVVGGPPCQGFSLLNRNRDTDPRKALWQPFFDVVEVSKADIFVMENVPTLLGTPEHSQILQKAGELGFRVRDAKLLATDYGVPQTRQRAFIIGCRFADPAVIFPPRKTHFNPELKNGRTLPSVEFNKHVESVSRWLTVRDAIGDLEPPIGTEIRDEMTVDLHFGRNPTALSKQRYRVVSEEGMNRFDLQRLAPDLTPDCWKRKKSGGTDLFGRLWWDRPAFTIRTEFFKPEKGRYLHPEQDRPITHREAARLQGFPDEFTFLGSKIEIAKQIGNAVPPPMAARIADIVRTLLDQKYNDGRFRKQEAK